MEKGVIVCLFAGASFLTVGCAGNPTVSSLTSEEREKVGRLVVVEPGILSREDYEVLGTAEGIACKRNLHASGKPSGNEARQGVLINAAKMGADAVTNMLCEERQEVDWGRNCWQTVVCVGDAISVRNEGAVQSLRTLDDHQ